MILITYLILVLKHRKRVCATTPQTVCDSDVILITFNNSMRSDNLDLVPKHIVTSLPDSSV